MLGPVCPKCGFRIDAGTDKNDDKNKKEDQGFFEALLDEMHGKK